MVLKKKDKIVPVKRAAEEGGWVPMLPRTYFDEMFDRMMREMREAFWSPFEFEVMPGFREPKVDMIDKGDRVEIHADMPGIPKDKVSITFSDDELEIKGEVEEEKKEEHKGYYHYERGYSSYYRRLGLPEGLDMDKAEATMENGVLTIVLPKSQQQKEKKTIQVK